MIDFTPTPEDIQRDLEGDLWLFTGQGDYAAWVRFLDAAREPSRAQRFIDLARQGWPAAIRRAMTAEAELERLKAFTYCAYCGHTVDMDADGSVIAEHIRACEKHPMREVEAERDRLRDTLAGCLAMVEETRDRARSQYEHYYETMSWAREQGDEDTYRSAMNLANLAKMSETTADAIAEEIRKRIEGVK